MAGVVFVLTPTLAGAGAGLLCAYKLHASGESPLYRLVGELGAPRWIGLPLLATAIYAAAKLVVRVAPSLCPNGAFHKGGRELAEAMAMPVALGVLAGWGFGSLVGDAAAFGLPAGYLLVPLGALLCTPCALVFCGPCLSGLRSCCDSRASPGRKPPEEGAMMHVGCSELPSGSV